MSNKFLKLVLIIGLIIFVYLLNRTLNQHDDFEVNVQGGVLSGYSVEEIEKILQTTADENTFSFELNARPVFEDGNSEGNLRIANPPYGKHAIEVDISLDKTNELIFKSGKIKPEHFIESARLMKNLEAGEYEATAVIKAYDLNSGEYKGQTMAGLILEIKQ